MAVNKMAVKRRARPCTNYAIKVIERKSAPSPKNSDIIFSSDYKKKKISYTKLWSNALDCELVASSPLALLASKG